MVFLISFGCYCGFEWNSAYETNFIDELGTVILYEDEFEFGQHQFFR